MIILIPRSNRLRFYNCKHLIQLNLTESCVKHRIQKEERSEVTPILNNKHK